MGKHYNESRKNLDIKTMKKTIWLLILLIFIILAIISFINITKWYLNNKKNEEIYDIEATIYCLRESHKGIIIGKNGEMLKRIGQTARIDMEKNFGLKVNLKTWVKVKQDWLDNDKIINLDISTIDLSKVINAEYLCYSCKNLQSITLDFNNASNLLRIGNMISNCQKLTLLEIKNLNTSNIQNFSYAIYNCQTLKILDLSEWNFENARRWWKF